MHLVHTTALDGEMYFLTGFTGSSDMTPTHEQHEFLGCNNVTIFLTPIVQLVGSLIFIVAMLNMFTV